jgi:hypothetical protein
MRWPVVSLLLLSSCAASVIPAFEAARDDALRMPGPAPADWHPDAVLRMSKATVDDNLTVILEENATLTDKLELGPATIRPKLAIKSIELDSAPKCDECLKLDVDLVGTVKVSTVLGSSKVDLSGGATFDVALGLVDSGTDWQLTATPRSVRSVRVGLGSVVAGAGNLKVFLQDWIDQHLVSEIGEQTIADLGDADLPFRAVEVVPGPGSIELHLLTESGTEAKAAVSGPAPQSGWSLEMAAPTLLALARRASMAAEPLDFDVVPEPTRLTIEGDAFELGLRLWRVSGRGWWRDYTINGTVEARTKRVVLVPVSVTKDAASPGAALVDPLAFLGQGVILRTIETALNTSMPASRADRFIGLDAALSVSKVQGERGSVIVDGTLALTPAKSGGKRKKKR